MCSKIVKILSTTKIKKLLVVFVVYPLTFLIKFWSSQGLVTSADCVKN
jgi:hypothetical protein